MTKSTPDNTPLCVDVDGTLIRSDLLFESLLSYLKRNPIGIFKVIFLLLTGRAPLKRFLAQQWSIDVTLLPINESVVNLIKTRKSEGAPIILASASDEILLKQLAEAHPYFDKIIGSDGKTNLKSSKKAERLISEFGQEKFDYVGDSKADVAVWKASRKAYVVGSLSLIKKIPEIESSFLASSPLTLKTFFRAIRIHQWAKNFLVFLPVIFGHKFTHLSSILSAAEAFIAFSLTASSVYLINDLFDLESDRAHPTKKNRPIAAGILLPQSALLIAFILLFSGILIGAFVSWKFLVLLTGYFAITLAYSLCLKALALVDIITLAGLYTIRVFAGGVATNIPVSNWLLLLSIFLFFSLGALKRYTEMRELKARNGDGKVKGRGYTAQDAEIIGFMGISSGVVSVLVLALYINAVTAIQLYSNPQYLILTCPILLYWIGRVWLFGHRGLVKDDPVVFALNDRLSYVVIFVCFSIMLLAM